MGGRGEHRRSRRAWEVTACIGTRANANAARGYNCLGFVLIEQLDVANMAGVPVSTALEMPPSPGPRPVNPESRGWHSAAAPWAVTRRYNVLQVRGSLATVDGKSPRCGRRRPCRRGRVNAGPASPSLGLWSLIKFWSLSRLQFSVT